MPEDSRSITTLPSSQLSAEATPVSAKPQSVSGMTSLNSLVGKSGPESPLMLPKVSNLAPTLSPPLSPPLSVEQMGQLHHLLEKYWGYKEFRNLQLQAIAACLAKQDSLTVLPTGAGKSICFQLPALVLEGTAIVVSPLIALMKDQVDALRRRGIAAEFVNSSLTAREREKVMKQMSNGEIKLLYIAPERLMLDATLRFLSHQKLSFIAVDEAHCVSVWGHDFRPDYRKLGELKGRLGNASIHCFTATASPRVRDDIIAQLKLRNVHKAIADMDRPNLMYRMLPAVDRLQQISQIIDHYPKQSGIVFCLTRKDTENIASDLRQRGYNAAAYHAGFEMGERKRVQERFLRNQVDIIVATIAFGMGIDKPDIRFVIHNSLPQSMEHYLQECGRAGRDGLPSECVILYRGGDRIKRIALTESEPSNRLPIVCRDIHRMANFAAGSQCRRKSLLASMGQAFEHSNCGACDNCLKQVPTLEDSESVILGLLQVVRDIGVNRGSKFVRQKARSSTQPTENGFSLSGKNAAVLDRTTTLKNYTDLELEDFIEQILSLGLLENDGTRCVLKLSASGRKTLGDEKCSQLLLQRFAKPSPIQLGQWQPALGYDAELFRICTTKLAVGSCTSTSNSRSTRDEQTLREFLPRSFAWQLATIRPTDPVAWTQWLSPMLMVANGVERDQLALLQQVAEETCAWMQGYCESNQLSTDQYRWEEFIKGLASEKDVAKSVERLRQNSAANRVFPYFDSGMSIAECAAISGIATETAANYLSNYIEARQITDCTTWIPVQVVEVIESVIIKLGNDRLKPIFEHLEGKYSYGQIRVVSSCFNMKQRSGSLLNRTETEAKRF